MRVKLTSTKGSSPQLLKVLVTAAWLTEAQPTVSHNLRDDGRFQAAQNSWIGGFRGSKIGKRSGGLGRGKTSVTAGIRLLLLRDTKTRLCSR